MNDTKDTSSQKGLNALWNNFCHALDGLFTLPQWWAQALHKRDPHLWTFGAWDGLRYSDNSRALYEYMLVNHPEIQCVWMTADPAIYTRLKAEGKPCEMFYTAEGRRIQKRAGFFFATKGLFDGVGKYMNGIRFINLWHGVPIKKIGEDAMVKVRKKGLMKRIKTRIRRFLVPWEFISDKVICGSPFFAPFLKSAFALTDDALMITPEARLDWMSVSEKEKLVDELDKRFNYPTKVIYMPTFRDAEFGVFNPFVDCPIDIEAFNRVLEEKNIVFIYKGHFFDCNVRGLEGCERIITVGDNDYENLYSFIKDMDILVTDYSSVYFDFLLLDRPMILFPFDYDVYVDKSREFYFDYRLMEAKRVYSWQEMADCLAKETYFVPKAEEKQRFRPLAAVNCCSQIAERTLALIQ